LFTSKYASSATMVLKNCKTACTCYYYSLKHRFRSPCDIVFDELDGVNIDEFEIYAHSAIITFKFSEFLGESLFFLPSFLNPSRLSLGNPMARLFISRQSATAICHQMHKCRRETSRYITLFLLVITYSLYLLHTICVPRVANIFFPLLLNFLI